MYFFYGKLIYEPVCRPSLSKELHFSIWLWSIPQQYSLAHERLRLIINKKNVFFWVSSSMNMSVLHSIRSFTFVFDCGLYLNNIAFHKKRLSASSNFVHQHTYMRRAGRNFLHILTRFWRTLVYCIIYKHRKNGYTLGSATLKEILLCTREYFFPLSWQIGKHVDTDDWQTRIKRQAKIY